MKNAFFSRALPAFALAAVVLASLPASASLYNSLVVFGDSLSDSGNDALVVGSTVQLITGNTYVPGHPYAPGTTFSNGPVWASDAASSLGVPLLPAPRNRMSVYITTWCEARSYTLRGADR